MDMFGNRLKTRKEARSVLEKLTIHKEKVLLIHYGSESFTHSEGATPCISAIVVLFLVSGQFRSFSLHLTAEQMGIDQGADPTTHLQIRSLEQRMLEDFKGFLRKHKGYTFVHWNMRDVSFGFETLRHRWKKYSDEPLPIDDSQTEDLARLLEDIYTESYELDERQIGEDVFQTGRNTTRLRGKLLCLAYRNKLALRAARSGDMEAALFTQKKFAEIHASTARKVRLMEKILYLTVEQRLKVKSPLRQYGLSPQGIFFFLKNHWIGAILLALLGWFLNWLWGR